MSEPIRRMLPPVIQGIVDEVFDKPKVNETRADCAQCSMCNWGQASPVQMEYFHKETKCCTFFPALPNFMVGAILADPAADMDEGKRRVREIIKTRMGTLPMQLTRPRKMSFLMTNYGEAFGRAKSLLCPYFDTESPEYACTIWRHREAVCMTYYCKYDAGQRGYDFWIALKEYLFFVQRVLSQAAMENVDRSVKEPKWPGMHISPEDMDDLPPRDSEYAAWWGSWVGREEEFYVKCYEWVRGISRADFKKNADESPEGKKLLDQLRSSYDKLEHKILPANLVRNARMKEVHVDQKVVVTTYHRFDSFALDRDLYEVVGLFRADESLQQNLDRLAKEEGIELAPELVEYLFAAGVLVEPAPAAVASAKAPPKEAEAELRGRRAALRAVLDARKLEVDDAFNAKIETADTKTLDGWIAKAANAARLAEVQE